MKERSGSDPGAALRSRRNNRFSRDIMPPRTPKTPDEKPVKSKSAKPKAGSAAAKVKPALKVVEVVEADKATSDGAATVAGKGGTLKLKDLMETVASATGSRKPEVKAVVEATLAALGEALATGKSLAIPPLGKLRVVKNKGPALTLKLRLADGAKAAGLALADDGEDS